MGAINGLKAVRFFAMYPKNLANGTEGRQLRLILDNIVKRFGDKQVLRGAGFSFEQGNIYGLLGRNGAGKTTLFDCLGRRSTPIST
jgi:ABC-type polysaccharide/polyol phosphate transport system ATPase subunit